MSLLLLLNNQAPAGIIYQRSTSLDDSFNSSHTISAFDTAGTNAYLVVSAHNKFPTSEDSGTTADGSAMTLHDTSQNANVASVRAYGIIPADSSTDIVNSTPSFKEQALIAALFTGVDQTTPVTGTPGNTGNFSTSASVSYTGTSGNMLVAMISTQTDRALSALNDTVIVDLDHSGSIGSYFMAYVTATGSAQTIGATLDTADNWRIIVIELKKAAAGGTLYNKTLDASSAGTATIVRSLLLARTIGAVATNTATLTRQLIASRTLSASSAGAASLARLWTKYITLAASSAGAPSLARLLIAYRTLSSSSTGAATMTVQKLFFRTLNVTTAGVVSLARVVIRFVALSASSAGSSTLSRVALRYRTLSATSTGVPSLARQLFKLITLSATGSSAATLTAFKSFFRTLSATATSAATLAKGFFYSKVLSATGGSSASMSLLRINGRILNALGIAQLANFARFNGTGAIRLDHNSTVNVGNNDSYFVSFWMRADAGAADQSLTEKWDDDGPPVIDRYPWAIRGPFVNGSISFNIYDGVNNPGAGTGVGYADGNWHHIVGVRDYAGDVIKIYADKVLKATTADNTTGDVSTDRKIVIAGRTPSAKQFVGDMRDFRVHAGVPSQADVDTLFDGGNIAQTLLVKVPMGEGHDDVHEVTGNTSVLLQATGMTWVTGPQFRFASLFRTLSAVATSAATLTKLKTAYRTLSAVGSNVASITRIRTAYRTISAVAVSTPTLSRKLSRFMVLSAQASGNASISPLLKLARTLSASASGVATIVKAVLSSNVPRILVWPVKLLRSKVQVIMQRANLQVTIHHEDVAENNIEVSMQGGPNDGSNN